MKTIFVVMQCWNDWEDASSNPILATFDMAIAEAKVAEMLVRKDARKIIYDTINNHMAEWDKTNPRPREVLMKGLDKNKEFTKDFGNWIQSRHQEYNEFKGSFTQQEQDDFTSFDDKLYWEIETVPYEE